jgi:hypothetical protein
MSIGTIRERPCLKKQLTEIIKENERYTGCETERGEERQSDYDINTRVEREGVPVHSVK